MCLYEEGEGVHISQEGNKSSRVYVKRAFFMWNFPDKSVTTRLCRHLCMTLLSQLSVLKKKSLMLRRYAGDSSCLPQWGSSTLCPSYFLPGCGGILRSPQGTITSPGHPNQYPHGANCTWYISVQEGLIVELTFTTFILELSSRCQYDYVEVYDSNSAVNTSLVGRWDVKTFKRAGCFFLSVCRMTHAISEITWKSLRAAWPSIPWGWESEIETF